MLKNWFFGITINEKRNTEYTKNHQAINDYSSSRKRTAYFLDFYTKHSFDSF